MFLVYENNNYSVYVKDEVVLLKEEDNRYYVCNKVTGISDSIEDNYPDAVTIANYMDFIIDNGVFDILKAQLYEDWGIPVPKALGGPIAAVVPGDFGKH